MTCLPIFFLSQELCIVLLIVKRMSTQTGLFKGRTLEKLKTSSTSIIFNRSSVVMSDEVIYTRMTT